MRKIHQNVTSQTYPIGERASPPHATTPRGLCPLDRCLTFQNMGTPMVRQIGF